MLDVMATSFAERLFAAAGLEEPSDATTLERVDEVLASAVERHASARVVAKWPEHVAAIVDRDELAKAPLDVLSALTLEDVALALAAVLGEREAVAEVERTVVEPLPRTLSRLRPTPELVDELRQELREKLLVASESARAKLLDYRGRGPLGAWARVIALRAAYDRARTSARERQTSDEDALADLVDAADPPDLAELRRKYSAELREAFRAAARRLDAEQRAVLRSHAIDALTIDQIGALYQVHRATAARWVQQAKASLLAALRDELSRRLGEGHDACDSVVALVRSRIDLSLERALQDDQSL
jgi:RNA polymerase sigma-70 factor (ECF subfamily)